MKQKIISTAISNVITVLFCCQFGCSYRPNYGHPVTLKSFEHYDDIDINVNHDFNLSNKIQYSFKLQDQLRRFMEVHMTDMPPIVAAKKTKEFRSTPYEQVSGEPKFVMIQNFAMMMQWYCYSGLRI